MTMGALELHQVDEDSLAASLKRYAVALGTVAIASTLRLSMHQIVSTEAPFLLFFAAVMASGWYGGARPGLVATLASAVVASLLFMERPGDPDADTWKILRIGIFVLEGVITSVLCGQLHAARRRALRSAAEARELERTVEQISEAEQRRIGQDLHDGLGQHLTGVAFMSKALTQKLSADGRPEAADAATINQLVNESIRWTRDLARGLAPMDLDRTSLPESFQELARKTSRMFSVECTYDGIETLTLPDDEVALNLYRVAQEAVSNGVKHGKARNVTIDLRRVDGGLTLTVHDDGVGFDPAAVAAGPAATGMGLMVMRYRAGVIGAHLDIAPGPDGGTMVRCHRPDGRGGRHGGTRRAAAARNALAGPAALAQLSRTGIAIPARPTPASDRP
jgi:signal transduction histidine kinase